MQDRIQAWTTAATAGELSEGCILATMDCQLALLNINYRTILRDDGRSEDLANLLGHILTWCSAWQDITASDRRRASFTGRAIVFPDFFRHLIDTYSELRQLPALFSALLSAVVRSSACVLGHTLSCLALFRGDPHEGACLLLDEALSHSFHCMVTLTKRTLWFGLDSMTP